MICKNNKSQKICILSFGSFSRKEATRTPDPYVPNVVRYQLRYFPLFCECKDTHFLRKCQTFCEKIPKSIRFYRKKQYLCTRIQKNVGAIAQLVEQRTENPCVPGSIPGGTTQQKSCIGFDTAFFVITSRHWKERRETFHQASYPGFWATIPSKSLIK